MTGDESTFDEEDGLPGYRGGDGSASAAADAQLRELSLATEQIPTGIVITDPAYRIAYSNAMFRQITGFREAVVGLALTEILPEAPWQDLAATVRRGGIGHGDVFARRASLEIFEASVSVAALRDGDGGVLRFIVTLADCSRRKEQERGERRTHLLQASRTGAIGQLVGGIAHDFNSLLGAVIGFASFLEQDLPDGTNERHFATRILTACEQAKGLAAQIIALAQAGRTRRQRIDVGTVLRDSHDLLGGALPSSTRLEFRVAEEALPVHGNAEDLSRAIVNLCLNANDALNGEQGTISVEATKVRSGDEDFRHVNDDQPMRPDSECRSVAGHLDQKRGYVRIRVADTGCGIEPEILPHIFEPFFTTKERGRATGLGLAAVGALIADGGACSVESRRGGGTVFALYLPLVVERKAAEAATMSVPTQLQGRERILLVDDERELADMLSIGLERLGYAVAVATDPAEALGALAEEPDAWDVVVIASTMPGTTGLALIGELTALRPALKVVFCTDFHDGIMEQAAPAPGVDFLPKPVDVPRLATRIRVLMGRGAPTGTRPAPPGPP